MGKTLLGIAAQHHGIAPPAHIPAPVILRRDGHVGLAGGCDVLRAVGIGHAGVGAGSVADAAVGHQLAQRQHCQAVRLEHVVRHGDGAADRQPESGGVNAVAVAQTDKALRLVEGDEILDAVAECFGADGHIFLKPLGAVGVFPRAFGLQGAGIIPVEEGHEGTDAIFEEFVDELIVEVEAFLVDFAGAVGQNARPCHRETVVFDAQLGHQADILAEQVVVITRNIARVAAQHLARGVAHAVPYGIGLAVLIPCAFNLIGGRGGAPDKILSKAHCEHPFQ